jgi:hypothetical protein
LSGGDWLIGWSGGLEHYSWFRFTPGSTDPHQGTVRTLPATCVACDALSCAFEPGEGTYEVVVDEVNIMLPGPCPPSFRLTNLSSPADSVGGPWSGTAAIVSAQVVAGVDPSPAFQALLFAPGVGCDEDFTTCSFPPP